MSHAQCTGAGVAVGACTATTSYEGCCGDFSKVVWCENGTQCELDCVQNLVDTPTNSCCEAALFGEVGCCDTAIMACVCAIDAYCCESSWDSVCASQVTSFGCGMCPAGCPGPAQYCGWSAQGYYDCSPSPGADPSGIHPKNCQGDVSGGGPGPGPGCSCEGKECGDDGCGGSCGTCTFPEQCDAFGHCGEQGCQPDCFGKQCGDDGCGGTCGECASGQVCTNAVCVSECFPNCVAKVCGDDGCGGSCGTCAFGLMCSAGSCVEECEGDCAGKVCGDDGCGGSCGGCFGGTVCNDLGLCVAPEACDAQCDGKVCGDDGCGGSCGGCFGGTVCNDLGLCVAPEACDAQCDGTACGPDGCGGFCGSCPVDWACQDGACVDPCVPTCGTKECGSDGCGGSCGACAPGWGCDTEGVCYEGCDADCVNRNCGSDGCGGICGSCAPGVSCDDDLGQCLTEGSESAIGEGDSSGDVAPCSCEGRECGSDGCGGSCGICPEGLSCLSASGRCTALSNAVDGPCEAGEVYNALAGGCVLADVDSAGADVQAQGCSGGAQSHMLWTMAVGVGLFVWRRRRPQPLPHRTCRS